MGFLYDVREAEHYIKLLNSMGVSVSKSTFKNEDGWWVESGDVSFLVSGSAEEFRAVVLGFTAGERSRL